MGDMAEDFYAYRAWRSETRRSNLEKSTALLVERGVKFESRNDGLHLMIETAKGRVNFYPSTGLYYGAIEGRGVFNLLKELKGLNDEK